MFSFVIQFTVIFAILGVSTADSICDMRGTDVVCNNKDFSEIPTQITANAALDGITSLDLSNNQKIVDLKTNSFESYPKLQHLKLTNCGISKIEEGVFDGLSELKFLDLSNNNLKTFSVELVASSAPNLENISLANNEIESLEDYNSTVLPNLVYLDISNNKLTFLPQTILEALSEINDLTIRIEGNSWNCENDNWREYVQANNITEIFCPVVEEYTTQTQDEAETTTVGVLGAPESEATTIFFGIFERSGSANNNNTSTSTEDGINSNSSLSRRELLAIWIILAILGGVLLGNLDRIFKLVCSKRGRSSSKRRNVPDEEIQLKTNQ